MLFLAPRTRLLVFIPLDTLNLTVLRSPLDVWQKLLFLRKS